MKTRSSPSKRATPKTTAAPTPSPSLVEDNDPLVMILLPKHDKASSRILSLPNSRTGELNKYLFVPDNGVFEFKRIGPLDAQKSILTVYEPSKSDELPQNFASDTILAKIGADLNDGYMSKAAFALVATPIDPVWLVLPILSPATTKTESSKRLFQPIDDLFDNIPEDSGDLRYLVSHDSFREMLSTRMGTVCDTIETGDEKMYRLSEEKLAKKVITIAKGFSGTAFPSSMEDHFVRRALETPVLAVKREDVSTTVENETEESQATVFTTAISVEAQESQSAADSISTSTTQISTPMTEISSFTSSTLAIEGPPPSASLDVVRLQRIRTALSFILASYVPPHLSTAINAHVFSSESSIDFTPLNEHLKQVAALRAEALASRSMGDFSRKRTLDEDDEAAESRAEKKRRLEEEERKRKLGESRGVRDLKKVNTKGMKKMSDFFGKGAPRAKT